MVKTYVVTGASRGLGLEFVKQLLDREGVKVIAGARNPSSASALQELGKTHSDRLKIVKLDQDDEQSTKGAASEIAAAFPAGITVLINNAAIAGTEMHATALDTPLEDLQSVFKTNVIGPLLVSKYFVPLFKKGDPHNAIINISSTSGCIGEKSKAVQAEKSTPFSGRGLAYSVSKAALNMETVILAQQLKPEGIAVVSLHPGWVQTDMGYEGGRAGGLNLKPDMTTPESIEAQLKVIDSLTLDDSGKFYNIDGSIHPW